MIGKQVICAVVTTPQEMLDWVRLFLRDNMAVPVAVLLHALNDVEIRAPGATADDRSKGFAPKPAEGGT